MLVIIIHNSTVEISNLEYRPAKFGINITDWKMITKMRWSDRGSSCKRNHRLILKVPILINDHFTESHEQPEKQLHN